jgi:2,4-dienoyl-CoA reductase-like NADH-dependent reductase (Old Yellow Enzyme family)
MSYADAIAFQPASFAGLALRNRIVMAPMTRRMADDDGVVTAESVRYYRRRAAGEVGLIISEGTAIDSAHAYDTITVPRIETDEQVAGWRRVCEAIHAEGGAFAPQLWHTGPKADNPIGPSDGPSAPRKDGSARPPVRAMNADDFHQVIGAFVHAAVASKDIGCDAIELHGAHGYLLDSFLSPAVNQREDDYGGSFENRMRFPLEATRAVRAAVGPDYPILYRFSQWSIEDYNERKFRHPDELAAFVTALKEAGVDILHVSTRRATDPAFEDVSDRTLAGWTRELSGLPTIAVGSVSVTLTMDEAYGEAASVIDDPGPGLALVEDGEADLLAVGRALIPNPDWVKIVRDGDWRQLKPFHKEQLKSLA